MNPCLGRRRLTHCDRRGLSLSTWQFEEFRVVRGREESEDCIRELFEDYVSAGERARSCGSVILRQSSVCALFPTFLLSM